MFVGAALKNQNWKWNQKLFEDYLYTSNIRHTNCLQLICWFLRVYWFGGSSNIKQGVKVRFFTSAVFFPATVEGRHFTANARQWGQSPEARGRDLSLPSTCRHNPCVSEAYSHVCVFWDKDKCFAIWPHHRSEFKTKSSKCEQSQDSGLNQGGLIGMTTLLHPALFLVAHIID